VARTVKAALVSAGIAMRPMHAQVHK
jgi:hypothetical protein